MPECGNCDAYVTDRYVRVFSHRGEETVYCCPQCPDKVRRDGSVEEARSTRRAAKKGAAKGGKAS